MEFFKKTTTIDFMKISRWAAAFSIFITIASIVIICVKGLNFGLEFTGGTAVQVAFEHPANVSQMREQMLAAQFKDVVVQTYGPVTNAMIRLSGHASLSQEQMAGELEKIFPDVKVLSVNFIGPQVGAELATDGALALFVALIGTAIYIALRFEYRFAISALVALIHDPIVILGIFSLFGIEFDIITLAAILTIMGYSLNDTIVVFDRVRENFRKLRKGSADEIVNLSVNQTLSRTIMTSGLTLLAVTSLLIFGGEVLFGFSLALFIGIIIGTYSSIYVAGAFAVKLGLSRIDFMPKAKELDDRP